MTQSSRARSAVALTALVLAVAAFLALPSPASAVTYSIKLVDGGEFQSRYQPEEASWDTTQILFLTDVGNWVAVAKDDIESVTTDTENKGFGRVIDSTTIALGWAPNDAEVPEEGTAPADPMAALRALLDRPAQNYNIEQFVEPSDASGGLPVTFGAGVSTAEPGVVNP